MMKKYISWVGILSLLFVFAACMGDDENSATYYTTNDTGITAFSLSAANQYLHTTGSEGQDSIYKKTVTVSDYEFYIDQENSQIYNPDSLPYGTDAKHILLSISTKNSGQIFLKNVANDSTFYYSSTDSIDFSSPRTFQILSLSGSFYRNYTVKVNIHQQEGDDFNWHQLSTNNLFANMQAMKAFAAGGNVYLFGFDGAQTQLYQTAENDGQNWLASNQLFDANAYKNVVTRGDDVFVLNAGQILRMNAGQWTVMGTSSELKQLVAASATELYAIGQDGSMMVSRNDGASWTVDTQDEGKELLPADVVSFTSLPLKTNDDIDMVVMAGLRNETAYPNDTIAVVWTKLVEYSDYHREYPWTYVDIADDNNYALPRLANVVIMNYDNGLLAMGGSGVGACTKKGFDSFYYSQDGGITWKTPDYTLPTDMNSSNVFTATVDSQNFIWIICGQSGEIWRGRLNRMGWTKEQNEFLKVRRK